MTDPTNSSRFLLEWGLRLLLDNTIRYVAFAGVAWILCFDFFKDRLHHRKVNPQLPMADDLRREIIWSFSTIAVYSAVSLATVAAVFRGYGRLYQSPDEYGWLWFGISPFAAIMIHDTWFFWTHMAMHQFRLLKRMHRVHHLSVNPTPWAAYSFSTAEAFLQSMIFPILVLGLPLHPVNIAVFLLWMILLNVIDHTGVEYTPRWFAQSRMATIWMTPTAHVMHHETGDCHFGLYFLIWDRLMGTISPDYLPRLQRIVNGKSGSLAGDGDR